MCKQHVTVVAAQVGANYFIYSKLVSPKGHKIYRHPCLDFELNFHCFCERLEHWSRIKCKYTSKIPQVPQKSLFFNY